MRPHDLLRLKSAAAIGGLDMPPWVAAAVARAPWVVVRRGRITSAAVPVGIRGDTRAQRYATTLGLADIAQTITPEALSRAQAWRLRTRAGLPALNALVIVATAADRKSVV